MTFQVSGRQTALTLIQLITKSGASSLPEKRRMWMTLGGMWLMCELEWNRALLTIPSISGADVSNPTFEPQEDILDIHRDKLRKTF